MDNLMILRAADFAARKHRAQRRKDRNASPYINHPISVALMIAEVGGIDDPETLAAALLHDTVEDTNTSPEELESKFGKSVRQLVEEVTDDKSLPKQQRKKLQIKNAQKKSHRAKQIKIADKTCNIFDIANSPPHDWTFERKLEYLNWSKDVIDGLRGSNEKLEVHFDNVLSEALKKINPEEVSDDSTI